MRVYQTYKTAKRHAIEKGLILAEFGDYATPINGKTSYCFWNKTGNRHDKPIIFAQYNFDSNGRAI